MRRLSINSVAVGIFSCILFLWPCLSTLTVKAIEGAGERVLWTETQESFRVSFRRDVSGKEYILAERLNDDSFVKGLKDIRLYADNSVDGPVPSMLGKSSGESDKWMFYPAFPLQSGLSYLVAVSVGDPSEVLPFILNIPAQDKTPMATVSAVYPSRSELPENLLKFYLHFSHPMSVGNVYDFIHLIDDEGDEVELPFLELGEELWDYDSQRLTLLFDPGRIKTGLVPNLQEGLPLHVDREYTLKIDSNWQDAKGQPLVEAFEKTFRVIAGDRISPNPYNWKKTWPAINTLDAVSLTFPESLDEALLQRVLVVLDKNGDTVDGSIRVTDQETHWEFTPSNPWKADKYRVEIETILEDVAGNSIARPFELDKKESESYRAGPEVVYLDFVPTN